MFLKIAFGVTVAGFTYLQQIKQGNSKRCTDTGKKQSHQCGIIRAQDAAKASQDVAEAVDRSSGSTASHTSSAHSSPRSATPQGRELLAQACAKPSFTGFFVALEEDRQLELFEMELFGLLQRDDQPYVSSDSDTDSCCGEGC